MLVKKGGKHLLLICVSWIGYNVLQAQSSYQISDKSFLELKQEQVAEPLPLLTHSRLIPFHLTTTPSETLTLRIQTLSLSKTYWEELGFFCKMEIKMEQKARFPVKFRLGTVDYVDRLEGKYD